MNLAGPTVGAAQGIYSSSSVKQHKLGQIAWTPDGRKFQYCLAGETLVAGHFYQTAIHASTYVHQAVPAVAAIGATTISVTTGAAFTANQFADGYAIVAAGTGIGQMFLIKSHPAADSGASCVLTLDETVRVALDTTSKITTIKNTFDSIVDWATTQTGSSAGAAIFPITSGEYGWLQTGGMSAALSDNVATAAETTGISPSTTTAGTITKAVTTQETIGGSAQVVTVSAEVAAVRLNIN